MTQNDLCHCLSPYVFLCPLPSMCPVHFDIVKVQRVQGYLGLKRFPEEVDGEARDEFARPLIILVRFIGVRGVRM